MIKIFKLLSMADILKDENWEIYPENYNKNNPVMGTLVRHKKTREYGRQALSCEDPNIGKIINLNHG